MEILGGILLFIASVTSVYTGVKLATTSKTHLDAGTEKASIRKWSSLFLIIFGFFLFSASVLMFSGWPDWSRWFR